MREDPIVAEVRRVRDRLAAAFNYDARAVFADIRRRQESLGARLIRKRRTGKRPARSMPRRGR